MGNLPSSSSITFGQSFAGVLSVYVMVMLASVTCCTSCCMVLMRTVCSTCGINLGAGFCLGGKFSKDVVRIWASWWIAAIVASPIWEKVADGAGFCIACASSFTAVTAFSVDDGNDISQWCWKIRWCPQFLCVLFLLRRLQNICNDLGRGLCTSHLFL